MRAGNGGPCCSWRIISCCIYMQIHLSAATMEPWKSLSHQRDRFHPQVWCRALSSCAGTTVVVLHHGTTPQLFCKCQRRRDGSRQSAAAVAAASTSSPAAKPAGPHHRTPDRRIRRGKLQLLAFASAGRRSTSLFREAAGCGRSAAAPQLTPSH